MARGPPKAPLSKRVKILASVGAAATIVGWGMLLTCMALPDWMSYDSPTNNSRTVISLWMECVTTTGQNGTATTCLGYMLSLDGPGWPWTLTRCSMLHAFLFAIGGLVSFISFLPEQSLTILAAGAVCNLVAAGLTLMSMIVFTAAILVPMISSAPANGYENTAAGIGFYLSWFCTIPNVVGGVLGIKTATEHNRIVKDKAMQQLKLFMQSQAKEAEDAVAAEENDKPKPSPWGKVALTKMNGTKNGIGLPKKKFLAPIVDHSGMAPID
ncbi:Hypp9086 [Branchiostoma lanceolatum]|uniref:Hypp9086 protein n=1 Tax=Branchiostoma lanceolatum TaxID=7740 RepID=A0A8J9ZBW5_BRALA|nr:Hypp9086 [Branchiostoma lanceolatum]